MLYAKEEKWNNTEIKKIKIGSICCGMGGFDKGAESVGFETVWAVDIMKEACESFKANFPNAKVINKNAHNIDNFNILGEVDVLIFGPPCQGFSIANTRRKAEDLRNDVYRSTLTAVKQTDCKMFIFENVKGLLTMKNKNGDSFFEMILNDYENCGRGYKLKWKLIDCSKVGVPQLNRHRIIIVGVRTDIDFEYEFLPELYGDKMPLVTLRDTIYHLKDKDQSNTYDTSGYSPMYLGRNRQKTWDEPSYTIEASGRQAKLHPDYGKMIKLGKNNWYIPDTCRKLSTLECKLLQTFPEEFIVAGRLAKQYEQIGNAVPPKLAEHICKPIADYFMQNNNLEKSKDCTHKGE